MRLVLVICLLAGCYVQPIAEVQVEWSTAGRASDVPESQVGAYISYLRSQHHDEPYRAGRWEQGYAGELDLFVDAMTSTSTICMNLERREPIDHGHWGCSDCPDVELTMLTMQQCKDVLLEEAQPRVTFDFSIAP